MSKYRLYTVAEMAQRDRDQVDRDALADETSAATVDYDYVKAKKSHPVNHYRWHNCSRKHRTYRALAQCIWPRAEWINGEGEWASLAHCRVLTIQLLDNRQGSEVELSIIDSSACGGHCDGYAGHQLVQLHLDAKFP